MLLLVLLVAWIASIAVAVRSFPATPEIRHRLYALWLMFLPWGLAILSGPFVIDHLAVDREICAWMTTCQYVALAFLFVITAVAIARAQGARLCASAISFANFIPIFLLVSISVMIIDPGS